MNMLEGGTKLLAGKLCWKMLAWISRCHFFWHLRITRTSGTEVLRFFSVEGFFLLRGGGGAERLSINLVLVEFWGYPRSFQPVISGHVSSPSQKGHYFTLFRRIARFFCCKWQQYSHFGGYTLPIDSTCYHMLPEPKSNYQVIQSDLFISIWRSLSPWKGHLTIPKRSQRISRYCIDFCTCWQLCPMKSWASRHSVSGFHWKSRCGRELATRGLSLLGQFSRCFYKIANQELLTKTQGAWEDHPRTCKQ